MSTKTFKESYQHLTKTCSPMILDLKKVDLNELVNVLVEDYLGPKIQGIEKVNPDADMLLFEYGNYDWTGDGMEFNFSLRRQIFI